MPSLILTLTIAIPVLTAIYTWNYARWAWRKDLKPGAVGLGLLALATLILPLYLVWVRA